MSQHDALKKKLESWLQEEDFQISDRPEPNADFGLRIDNAFGLGYIVNVFKPKEKPFLVIIISLAQPKEVQTIFNEIDAKERFRFIEGMKRELLKMEVDYNIPADIGRIIISKQIYVEDMTRTSFVDGIRKVRDGTIFTVSNLSQKLSAGTSIQQSPSHSSSTPYG